MSPGYEDEPGYETGGPHPGGTRARTDGAPRPGPGRPGRPSRPAHRERPEGEGRRPYRITPVMTPRHHLVCCDSVYSATTVAAVRESEARPREPSVQPANQRFPMDTQVMVIYGTRPEAVIAPLPVRLSDRLSGRLSDRLSGRLSDRRCTTAVAAAAAGPLESGRPVAGFSAKPLV